MSRKEAQTTDETLHYRSIWAFGGLWLPMPAHGHQSPGGDACWSALELAADALVSLDDGSDLPRIACVLRCEAVSAVRARSACWNCDSILG